MIYVLGINWFQVVCMARYLHACHLFLTQSKLPQCGMFFIDFGDFMYIYLKRPKLVLHSWKFGGTVENLMHEIKMFDRSGALNLDGFSGSGADWLERYKPLIEDGLLS